LELVSELVLGAVGGAGAGGAREPKAAWRSIGSSRATTTTTTT